MLVRMLSNPKDINAIAKDRKSNMSKIARESVGELVELVTKSPAFPESGAAALSPQFISLKVLDSLVRKLREHGNHDNILPQGAVNTLVGIMKPFIGIKEYPKTSKINSSALLSLVISILEAYSIGGRIQFRKELSLAELEIVAGLLPILLEWAKDQNLGTNMDLGMDIQLALRFYINISNDFADVCDIIGPSLMPVLIGLVKKSFAVLDGTPEEQERAAYLDLLVLSFGLLLNFAELSAASRESVRTKSKPNSLTLWFNANISQPHPQKTTPPVLTNSSPSSLPSCRKPPKLHPWRNPTPMSSSATSPSCSAICAATTTSATVSAHSSRAASSRCLTPLRSLLRTTTRSTECSRAVHITISLLGTRRSLSG